MSSTAFTIPERFSKFETMHRQQISHLWSPPEISSFSSDINDWSNMDSNIRRRIKGVVNVLTQMEPAIMQNISDIDSIMKKILPSDLLHEMSIIFILLDFQKAMEGIHVISYKKIDDILVIDNEKTYNEEYGPFMKAKVDVISKWRGPCGKQLKLLSSSDQRRYLARAIIGNIASEGLVFNTLFSFLQYLSKLRLLPKVTFTNEEVRIDENYHTSTGIQLLLTLIDIGEIPRLPQDEVYSIIEEFVAVDDMAIDVIFKDMKEYEKKFFLVMNAENSKKYTRIVANVILQAIGYKPLYPYTMVDNPYDFTESALLHDESLFFDKEVALYGIDHDNQYHEDSDPEYE